jgi:hypothetical protein
MGCDCNSVNSSFIKDTDKKKEKKESISSTFYARLFHTNVSRETFLYLDLRFKLFWRKNIGAKTALIMLVKLTQERSFLQFCSKRGGKKRYICSCHSSGRKKVGMGQRRRSRRKRKRKNDILSFFHISNRLAGHAHWLKGAIQIIRDTILPKF